MKIKQMIVYNLSKKLSKNLIESFKYDSHNDNHTVAYSCITIKQSSKGSK